MFKRIGIVSNLTREGADQTLTQTVQFLASRDVDIVVGENAANLLPLSNTDFVSESEVSKNRDLVIAIGGDGTMLRSGKAAFLDDVPILGINLGRLGFLTDISPVQLRSALDAILSGEFEDDRRTVLSCDIIRDGAVVASAPGLNDIVIQKWNTARLITLDTSVDGQFVHSQRSDGMIVSTPTGSTAYALSGGGPIVHPELSVVVLVPICPHSLTNRPIIITDDARIEITVNTESPDQAQVTCDGETLSEVNPGDIVKIYRHPKHLRLIHPAGHDHFATLRAKLHWGRAPC
ncbi:MAG: NAD(+) kinase [Pseudomonadota bacterium]